MKTIKTYICTPSGNKKFKVLDRETLKAHCECQSYSEALEVVRCLNRAEKTIKYSKDLGRLNQSPVKKL